jgi:hypothetical protein
MLLLSVQAEVAAVVQVVRTHLHQLQLAVLLTQAQAAEVAQMLLTWQAQVDQV